MKEPIQGTMLPTKWDKKTQARVVKNLGFDPENPMVKMEIGRILTMGSSYPGVPFAYQKLVANSVPDNKVRKTSNAATAMDSLSEQSVMDENKAAWQNSLYFIAGLSVLIIAGGLIIVFRTVRRKSQSC